MSNDNGNGNGNGLFSSLVIGAGFVGILLLPVYLMHRFGIQVMSVVMAIGMTGLAIITPSMIDGWLQNHCTARHCPADALYGLLTALPAWGWWAVALGMWLIIALQSWLRLNQPLVSHQS